MPFVMMILECLLLLRIQGGKDSDNRSGVQENDKHDSSVQ